MAQKRGFTLLEFIGAVWGLFVERLGAEGIGGEEAVGADMPRRGEAEAGGVVQHGHADVLATDDAVVVAPFGAFAPGRDVGEAFAIDDVTAAFFVLFDFNRHLRGDADAESGVFFVFKFGGAFGGQQDLLHLDAAGAFACAEDHGALFFEVFFSIRIEVVDDGDEHGGIGLGLKGLELAVFFAAQLADTFRGLGCIPKGEPFGPGFDAIDALAAKQRIVPMDMVYDQLLANNGTGMIYMPFFNYSYGDLSMTHELLQHPHTRNGLSDAGAHCGAICDGGMPTFLLTHWVRDRARGPRLQLEHMVHRQTHQTATMYGLTDRGLIAPGLRADMNLIDYESLNFDMPSMAYDFPANGRRLVQHAKGYEATFVNGTQIVSRDEFTGELPGKLLRGRR